MLPPVPVASHGTTCPALSNPSDKAGIFRQVMEQSSPAPALSRGLAVVCTAAGAGSAPYEFRRHRVAVFPQLW